MIKEQIFKLLLNAQGSTRLEHHPNIMTYKILNLFKAEVDKLTVMITGDEHITGHAKAQLQHTKKQLLDSMGEK